MNAFSLRKMTLRDYRTVMALWRDTPGIGLDDDSDSQVAIARYLRRNPGLSFVACGDGRIVGAVLSGHDGRRGYLHHLAVAPAYRGRGVARALVSRCLQTLARRKISRCNIFVHGNNRSGLKFWKRQGWALRTATPWLQIHTR